PLPPKPMRAAAQPEREVSEDFPADNLEPAALKDSTSADSISATCSKVEALADVRLRAVAADSATSFREFSAAAAAEVSRRKAPSPAAISNIRSTCRSGRQFVAASCD